MSKPERYFPDGHVDAGHYCCECCIVWEENGPCGECGGPTVPVNVWLRSEPAPLAALAHAGEPDRLGGDAPAADVVFDPSQGTFEDYEESFPGRVLAVEAPE